MLIREYCYKKILIEYYIIGFILLGNAGQSLDLEGKLRRLFHGIQGKSAIQPCLYGWLITPSE